MVKVIGGGGTPQSGVKMIRGYGGLSHSGVNRIILLKIIAHPLYNLTLDNIMHPLYNFWPVKQK